MKYDENLPRYFTNHHRFLWERMDKNVLNDSKYFEKQEIRWFSVEDMKRKDQYYIYYVRCNSTLYNLGEEGITGHGHIIDFEDKVKEQIQEEYDQRLLAEPIVEHDISASLLQHDSDAPRRSQVRTRQSNKEPSPEKKVVRTRKTR